MSAASLDAIRTGRASAPGAYRDEDFPGCERRPTGGMTIQPTPEPPPFLRRRTSAARSSMADCHSRFRGNDIASSAAALSRRKSSGRTRCESSST